LKDQKINTKAPELSAKSGSGQIKDQLGGRTKSKPPNASGFQGFSFGSVGVGLGQ
jgi:hypothetical protein